MELSSNLKGLKFMQRSEERKKPHQQPTLVPVAVPAPQTVKAPVSASLEAKSSQRLAIQVSYEPTLIRILASHQQQSSQQGDSLGIVGRKSYLDFAEKEKKEKAAASTGGFERDATEEDDGGEEDVEMEDVRVETARKNNESLLRKFNNSPSTSISSKEKRSLPKSTTSSTGISDGFSNGRRRSFSTSGSGRGGDSNKRRF